MKEVRRELIEIKGGVIPITLETEEDEVYRVAIDGVEWHVGRDRHHAIIIFQLLAEHVTEYMEYRFK